MFEPAVRLPDDLERRPGKWFLFDQRNQLLLVDGHPLVADQPPDGVSDVLVMGHQLVDGDGGSVPVRAGRLDRTYVPPDEAVLVDLRKAFAVLDEEEWILAGRASQLLSWDRDHRFCSRCGAETVPLAHERARVCERCNYQAFPRLTPAVITLVERDDGQALLAWGRQFPGRFFSALAGFVEPGESLEQTVTREVREEVGIDVGDVRYFGSQPWPFPHSMMIGFNANYVGGELVLQEEEIVEAGWFPPEELPPVPRGRMSIAGWLIEDWLNRQRG